MTEKSESFIKANVKKALSMLRDFSFELSIEMTRTTDDNNNKYNTLLHNHQSKISEIIAVLSQKSDDIQLVEEESVKEDVLHDSFDIAVEEKMISLKQDMLSSINREKNIIDQVINRFQTEIQSSSKKIGRKVDFEQSNLIEKRQKKMSDLKKQISYLTKACAAQRRIIQNIKTFDVIKKNLKREIDNLTKRNNALTRQIHLQAVEINKWKMAKKLEVDKCNAMARRHEIEVTKLRIHQEKQNNVYEIKLEKYRAIEMKYKLFLMKQSQARDLRERFAKKQDLAAFRKIIADMKKKSGFNSYNGVGVSYFSTNSGKHS